MTSAEQFIDGVSSAVVALPAQAIRAASAYSPQIIQRLGLGDIVSNYYFDNPQLFKMPRRYRVAQPPVAPARTSLEPGDSAVGAFQEGTLNKALPFIALSIVAVVGYNIIKGK